jgi:23S rRNA (uracil1939-C5)-methyltransferase
MVAPNDRIALTIDKPAAGGRMIGRIDGQVALISGAIPGERVVARVSRVAKGAMYADTVAIERASDDRRPPFGDPSCGGCLYSHIAYRRQLAIKAEVIGDAFARIGRLALPSAIDVAASMEEGYRMRARLHRRGRRLGFFREGTHEVCNPRQTRQLLPETCDTVERLATVLDDLGAESVREIEISENLAAAERVVDLEWAAGSKPPSRRTAATLMAVEGLTPAPYVTDDLVVEGQRIALRRHVRSFFQGNRYLVANLAAHVVDCVPVGTGLLDLYAGVGLFSIACAVLRNARVTAVEGDRFAASDLRANAAAAGRQLTTVHAPVEAFLSARVPAGPLGRGRPFETVVIDPPRTGMTRPALDGTLRLGAPRLVYVSCDVATLARDARRIVDAGYAIERIDGFDMFPNTPHVETIVVFQTLE